MIVGKIVSYGLYNSKKAHPNRTFSNLRKVTCFEIDYITSCSQNAVSYINDKQKKLFPHLLIVRKPGETSYSHLHFNCYCLHIEIEKNNPIYQQLLDLPNYFTILNQQTYQLLFESLFKHLLKEENNRSDYFTTAKLLELVYHLIKDSKQNHNSHITYLHKENLPIQKAIAFMKKNLSKKISLQMLGQITNYSPNHFRQIFTDIMGISPQKYLETLRINHAKYLLTQNELSLSGVAYACGFCSQAYFSKLFRNNLFMSPKEYREHSIAIYKQK